MIADLLQQVSHRPWLLPKGPWSYYQEWNRALFLHWKVPVSALRSLIPAGLEPDTFEGEAWVSLVAFTMERIRPAYLPAVSFLSDFHEINLRTYVTRNGKPGVYFLNIEAARSLSVVVARALSGLPYGKAHMKRMEQSGLDHYVSDNREKAFRFEAAYLTGEPVTEKSPLDLWLTERYCLYVKHRGRLRCYDIHHKPWDLKAVEVSRLNTGYAVGSIQLAERQPDLVHYSEGVQVLAWRAQQIL